MTGTLNIRLTGGADVVRAIYERICAASPRGPRGGMLYRCCLKERDNGIVQLYADLPLAALGNLLGAEGTTRPIETELLPLTSDSGGSSAGMSTAVPPRLQVDYRRR